MSEKFRLTSEQVEQVYNLAKVRYPDLFDNKITYNDSMYNLYYKIYPSIIKELGYS